jgi:outer membrane receptor protein involved in Fe transport
VPPHAGPTPLCDFPIPADYQLVQNPDKAFVSYNSGKIRVRGADVTLDWQHPLLGRFLFSHAMTWISTGGVNDADAEDSAPRHATSLLWSKGFAGGFEASLGVYYLDDMMWMGDGDKQADYTRVDLRLAKRFGKSGGEDEVAVTVRNLNGNHQEFRDNEYTVERQALATLRLTW